MDKRRDLRSTLGVLAVFSAVALQAAAPADGAAAAEAEAEAEATTFVAALAPVAGEVVAAGDTVVRARVRSEDPVTAAWAAVGDERVPADIGPTDPARGTEVAARLPLPAGDHLVRVEAQDAAGRHVRRDWWVTATDRTVERHAGPSRIHTAVAASAAAFPTAASAPAAIVARSDDFADALAGVPLAAAVEGPLLLSPRHALPAETAGELRRVLVAGGTVHLLGGEAALGAAVARAVDDLGFPVRRHAGPDRFATAAAVARTLPASAGAVVASGRSFPDALAASVPAARHGWPVLLTGPTHLPASAAAALAERAVRQVTIVGGTAVVAGEVERRVGEITAGVRRVAGSDRYATAAAIAEAFSPQSAGLSLASGADFPDALAGARHAAARGQALLLTRPTALPGATADIIRSRRPQRLDIYGGPAAVSDDTASAALRAAVDGPHAPRATAAEPAAGQTVAFLDTVTVRLDRPVDPARSSVHVVVAGEEVRGTLEATAPTDTLTLRISAQDVAVLDAAWPGRIVVRAVTADGAVGRHTVTFTYFPPDPFFATAGEVALYLPSREVALIGFHEANHPGAREQAPRITATPKITLPSRGRGTGARTAADVVASPDQAVLAPVTGRVVRAGSYLLYCRYPDDYVVIEPDDRPGWEVKVLHVHGLRVSVGDRVVARQTALGAGPRVLPLVSQVDGFSPHPWPHVHVEVIDPAIPPGPGSGC